MFTNISKKFHKFSNNNQKKFKKFQKNVNIIFQQSNADNVR